MKPRKLEQYKYFQPIAWTLCLTFAGFVGMLTLELRLAMANMQNTNINFEHRLQAVEDQVGL